MKIKSLLRFVLLLACLTIGVETYAEGTIEIKLISKNGGIFTFDSTNDSIPKVLSADTNEGDLRILATAGGTALGLSNISITDTDGDDTTDPIVLLTDTKDLDDKSLNIFVNALKESITDTNKTVRITFSADGYATRTLTFVVDNTTILDFDHFYFGDEHSDFAHVGGAMIGVSMISPRDGGFEFLTEGTDYEIVYSTTDNAGIVSITGNTLNFLKEGHVTITATLNIKKSGYACPKNSISDDFYVVAPATLQNTEKGYLATFSSIHNRDFSGTGIEVYIIQDVDGNKAKLTRVTDHIVNANQGVLLYSTSEKTKVVAPIAASASETSYEGNLLKATGADDQTVDGANDYILQNQEGHLAFYKATGKKMKANRAYLQFPQTTAGVRSLELNFDDETTGISEVSTDTDSQAVYYNLGGQRISQPRKGSIFVKNGKKIVR